MAFLGHHYYILGFSDLYSAVEKRIFEEFNHLHYMTQIFMPEHRNPCPGVISVCLTYICQRVENIVKVIMHFHYMTNMVTTKHKTSCPRSHEIQNFGSPLSNLIIGVEKTFKPIMYFHYMTVLTTPYSTRTPGPLFGKFTS